MTFYAIRNCLNCVYNKKNQINETKNKTQNKLLQLQILDKKHNTQLWNEYKSRFSMENNNKGYVYGKV